MRPNAEKMIVVSFFEELDPGYRFPAGDWPMHLTLVRPFTVAEESVENLEARLAGTLFDQDPIEIVFEEKAQFGPQKDVPVTTVRPNAELQLLHDRLLALVDEGGAINNSRWSGAEYRPHVTRQRTGATEPGETAELASASLLDYQDNTRTVRRTYPFDESSRPETADWDSAVIGPLLERVCSKSLGNA